MILLDTNVLSEFMRPNPAAQVVAWLDAQPPGEISSVRLVARKSSWVLR